MNGQVLSLMSLSHCASHFVKNFCSVLWYPQSISLVKSVTCMTISCLNQRNDSGGDDDARLGMQNILAPSELYKGDAISAS